VTGRPEYQVLEIDASRGRSYLGMTFNFNPKKRRTIGKIGGTSGPLDNLNGVHRFRIHPLNAPCAGMNWRFLARSVTNGAIRAMISNVRHSAAPIPIQEKTGPPVVMHWFGLTGGRDSNFEHAHECVFEDNFVAIGRGLHCVVTIRELGFVLSVKVKMTGKQRERTRNENSKNS
jgi:hypothetical protein